MYFFKKIDQSLFPWKKSTTHILGEIFPCTCEWIWWLEGPKSLQNKWISFQDMDWHGKAQVIDYLWVGLHLLQIGLKKNVVMDGLWDWQPFSLFWVYSGFTCLKDMNADHLKSFALFGGFVGFFNGEKGQGWRAPGDCKSLGRCFDVKRFEGWRPP